MHTFLHTYIYTYIKTLMTCQYNAYNIMCIVHDKMKKKSPCMQSFKKKIGKKRCLASLFASFVFDLVYSCVVPCWDVWPKKKTSPKGVVLKVRVVLKKVVRKVKVVQKVQGEERMECTDAIMFKLNK